MARKFAQLHVAASDDPDVEELSIEAQWLYFKVLLAHPALSSCGVMDWRPKHLVRKGKNASVVKILAAAAELEAARFLMFDLETEEVLMRSLVRRDELLKNPKMAGAVVKAYHAVASRELQAALVSEVKRVREEFPDYSSWSHKDTKDDLARILSRPDLAAVGYTNAFSDGITYGNTDVRPVEITNPDPVMNGIPDPVPNGDLGSVPNGEVVPGLDRSADSVRIPSTSTNTHNQHHLGGYVTGVRHQGAPLENDDPPPRFCPEHPGGTAEPCAACGIFRRAWESDAARRKERAAEVRAAERESEAEVRRLAIADCSLCDDDGYAGTRVCDHDADAEERRRRGLASARAVLAAKHAAKSTTPEPVSPASKPAGAQQSTTEINTRTERAHA